MDVKAKAATMLAEMPSTASFLEIMEYAAPASEAAIASHPKTSSGDCGITQGFEKPAALKGTTRRYTAAGIATTASAAEIARLKLANELLRRALQEALQKAERGVR